MGVRIYLSVCSASEEEEEEEQGRKRKIYLFYVYECLSSVYVHHVHEVPEKFIREP